MWNISNKSETSAIINNSCSKVSGFSVEDLSLAGKWFLKLMQGSVELPEVDENSANNNQQVTNAQITEQQTTASNNRKQTIAAEYKANLSNSWQANGKNAGNIGIIVAGSSNLKLQ